MFLVAIYPGVSYTQLLTERRPTLYCHLKLFFQQKCETALFHRIILTSVVGRKENELVGFRILYLFRKLNRKV